MLNKRFGEAPVITNHDAEHGHPQLADGLVQLCQAWKRPAGVLVTCQSALGRGQKWRSLTVSAKHATVTNTRYYLSDLYRQEAVATEWHLCVVAGTDYSAELVMLFKERELRGFDSFTVHHVWPTPPMMGYFLWSTRAEMIQISSSGLTLHKGKGRMGEGE